MPTSQTHLSRQRARVVGNIRSGLSFSYAMATPTSRIDLPRSPKRDIGQRQLAGLDI